MNGLELKGILLENPKMIEDVLLDLGCSHVKINNKYITSTRPNGSNKSSVYIKLNDLLMSNCFTKQSDFESRYEKRDFIDLVCFFRGDCNIIEAIKYICGICKLESNVHFSQKIKSESMSFLTKYKKITGNQIYEDDIPIDDAILDNFMCYPSYDFYNDNISVEIQEEFGVCYDIQDNRVCFPIRNKNGEVVSVKGRTLNKEYKLFGIPKYLYYENFHGGNILFGEFENQQWLSSADEIIVVESEKSVMALASYGVRNAVATCKKSITKQQLLRLLSYGKRIVIAYDKDVDENSVKLECAKFKGLVDTFYIYDEIGLLGEKDSPTDKGKDVFMWLFNDFKIKYER